MRWCSWWVVLLLATGVASAAEPPVQVSMIVGSTPTVNPDGSVRDYTLYKPEALPPDVVRLVRDRVPHWQFAPLGEVHGVPLETGMILRIAGDKTDPRHALVEIAGARFGCGAWLAKRGLGHACRRGQYVSVDKRKPPRYPWLALQHHVGGEVFLVLEIDRDGRVSRQAVRQVNLYVKTNDPAPYREALAIASVRAARNWRFRPPAAGPEAGEDHWVVQVPIHFRYARKRGRMQRQYGQWDVYQPGPRREVPWAAELGAGASTGADAIAGAFTGDPRLVLETPPGGG